MSVSLTLNLRITNPKCLTSVFTLSANILQGEFEEGCGGAPQLPPWCRNLSGSVGLPGPSRSWEWDKTGHSGTEHECKGNICRRQSQTAEVCRHLYHCMCTLGSTPGLDMAALGLLLCFFKAAQEGSYCYVHGLGTGSL